MSGYTVLPTKNPGDLLTSALWNTYLQGNADSGFARMLADTTLLASGSTVSISSIPATFAHLLLIVTARTTSANALDQINVQLNSDTAANYDYQATVASGPATTTLFEQLAQTSAGVGTCPGGGASANLFAASVIYIADYANTVYNKVLDASNSVKTGSATGNMSVRHFAAFWRSNAAVNTIVLLPSAGSFATSSRFTLIGIPH